MQGPPSDSPYPSLPPGSLSFVLPAAAARRPAPEDPHSGIGCVQETGARRLQILLFGKVTSVKRILVLSLLMLCLSAPVVPACGAQLLLPYAPATGYTYVTLGRYPQTAEGEVRPILWRVLRVDGEKAYLCSEYILFARPMHPSLKEYRDVLKGDFGQTELCHYLNTVFAEEAFTGEEMGMLLPCENFGKVFLLDASDVTDRSIGMGRETNMKKDGPGLRAWGTEFAIKNNRGDRAKERLYVFQKKYGAHSPYWVRNQSTSDGRHARCTKDGGQLGHIEVARENEGVRPAIYLALSGLRITGGAGTMEDPYTAVPAEAAEEPGTADLSAPASDQP